MTNKQGEKMIDNKIYCCYCRNYSRASAILGTILEESCMDKRNQFGYESNYRSPKNLIKKHPSELNKNNDCGWFVESK